MNPLTSATVLELWEAGLGLTPAARASLLLDAAGASDVGDWPVGRRDRALLEQFCGPRGRLDAVADCPSCGAALDVSLDATSMTAESNTGPAAFDLDDHHVVIRAVTVADLKALPSAESPDVLRTALLDRCVVRATRAGVPVAAAELPPSVVERIEHELDRLDPSGDIVVRLSCAECGEQWSESLDPVSFAWSAIEASARRLATDVHTLARAYGWSEREILELSPFRRHLYLSAVEG